MDDDGGADYKRIKDAIDNASDGDTIFVYSGNYNERIIIKKSINLIGEDKNTTIIDGNDPYNKVITIDKNYVNISKFTIQNGNNGILGKKNHCIIKNNIVRNCGEGITIDGDRNIIFNNIIIYSKYSGIYSFGNDNIFSFNAIVFSVMRGIDNWYGWNNTFYGNYIDSIEEVGVLIADGYENTVERNHISNCEIGVGIAYCLNNKIKQNNFFNNKYNAGFYNTPSPPLNNKNTWENNYWNKPRVLPYPILGIDAFAPPLLWILLVLLTGIYGIFLPLPNVDFDWNPAQEPYDIPIPEIP